MDDKLYDYVVAASAREADSDEEYNIVRAKLSDTDYNLAANDPIVDGKPRMLLLTAWIVHEGRNHNGQVFVKEELEEKVREGMFAPPHAGMIDFDHDFEPRGFWYKTSFAYDATAEKWGVLASGAVWAWRFSELADYILAEIQRHGSVPVSMSCKAESIEIISKDPDAEDSYSYILHNPVFITTSILDVPPADPNARAVATEEPSKELEAPAKEASQTKTQAEVEAEELTLSTASENKEHNMDEKAFELLEKQLADAEAARDEAMDKVETLKTRVAGLEKEAEETVESHKAAVAEKEVALSSASEKIEELERELATSKESLAQFEAEKAEAELEAQLAERLAELPDAVRKNLDEHPEKDAVIAAWKAADEDQWETIKQSFVLSAVTEGTDYTERSQKQGHIPTASGKEKGSGLARFIH